MTPFIAIAEKIEKFNFFAKNFFSLRTKYSNRSKLQDEFLKKNLFNFPVRVFYRDIETRMENLTLQGKGISIAISHVHHFSYQLHFIYLSLKSCDGSWLRTGERTKTLIYSFMASLRSAFIWSVVACFAWFASLGLQYVVAWLLVLACSVSIALL